MHCSVDVPELVTMVFLRRRSLSHHNGDVVHTEALSHTLCVTFVATENERSTVKIQRGGAHTVHHKVGGRDHSLLALDSY